MTHGSTKAVLTAVAGNSIVTVAKFAGFMLSGSSALLAEAVHSLADTANQVLLYVGLRRSRREADRRHHFGYGQERYFWNLVSAVTIFFVGCVYTIMHGVEQIRHAHAPEINWIAFLIVAVAFVVETYSLLVAFAEFNRQRREAGAEFIDYFRTTRDPTTLAVLIEDSVAVFGLLLALIGMVLAVVTGSGLFDAAAAIAIGVLMGFLALFLAMVNRKYLLNVADRDATEAAARIWQADPRIQRLQRVNSIVLSPDETLLMAELEPREETLFSDMSPGEIELAVRFMRRVDDLRRALEKEVDEASPNTRHIFIEFVLPEGKKP